MFSQKADHAFRSHWDANLAAPPGTTTGCAAGGATSSAAPIPAPPNATGPANMGQIAAHAAALAATATAYATVAFRTMAVCLNPKSGVGSLQNAAVASLEKMIWGTAQAALAYRGRQPPPLTDPPPSKRAWLPTSGSSSGKSPPRPIAQPPLPDLVVSLTVLVQSLVTSSQTLLTAANLVETLSAQAGRTYSDEHGPSIDGLRDLANKLRTIATTTSPPHVSHTMPGPPSLPPSPPGSPRTIRVGPAVSPSSAAYTVFTPHTAAVRCGATCDLPLSPTPFETRPSPGHLDPEIGFANGAPPQRLSIKLSAALATLTSHVARYRRRLVHLVYLAHLTRGVEQTAAFYPRQRHNSAASRSHRLQWRRPSLLCVCRQEPGQGAARCQRRSPSSSSYPPRQSASPSP